MKYAQFINDIRNAYSDCWMSNVKEAYKLRNLDFKSDEYLCKEEAMNTFKECIPGGYNEFSYELLEYLPDDSMIKIAREGSVCIYVKSMELKETLRLQKFLLSAMKADELHYNSGTDEYRIWWD